jgi:tetratricopeptide (TPR) repeat protein
VGDIRVTVVRPIGHAPTVFPRPKVVAQATPAEAGSKAVPTKPPIGQGSAADIPSPTNVSKDQPSQDPVSQLQAKIAEYEKQLPQQTDLKNRTEFQKNLGIAHIKLGNAYEKLGDRANKEEELKKAVTSFDEALKALKSNNALRVEIQEYRGIALIRLGGTENLKEAVMALDEALKVFKSHNASWAEIQKYRGIALIRLGGTEDIKKALTVFNEALKVFESNSDDARCAEIQDDIGLALESLAKNKRAAAVKNGDINELKAAKKLAENAADAIRVAIELGLSAQTRPTVAKDEAKLAELNISLQIFQQDWNTVQEFIDDFGSNVE